MISAGSIGLPLHPGRVPSFLTERMGRMGNAVIRSIVDNSGKSEVLTRMSDPNWFQAFGSLIGMQWNSSGVTAVVLGSLKRHINPDQRRSYGAWGQRANAEADQNHPAPRVPVRRHRQ